MERELLGAFEAAKKAADAASSGAGGPAAVDRCVDALRQLRQMPVTMKNLVDTQAGKRLRYLKKHPQTKIQTLASDLLEHWKNIVVSETANNDKKNSNSGDKTSVKIEVESEKTEIVKVEKISNGGTSSRSESFKVEKNDSVHRMKAEKVFKSELNTVGKGKCESIKVERVAKEEKIASAKKLSSTPTGPPKLTAMIKCNDPMRDKVRELLAEAFSRVSDETNKDNRDEVRNILDEVDSCDPIHMAVMVESVMFENLGRSNGSQKLKYRSIMFNLKDGKNTDFRRRVLLGHVEPESLINMTPEEMASDERKLSNKQIKEKALFECERGGPPKATTDQFKCGRCGQRKTTYYQLQTRSADEPMTTFVTCVNCNNHWKFC